MVKGVALVCMGLAMDRVCRNEPCSLRLRVITIIIIIIELKDLSCIMYDQSSRVKRNKMSKRKLTVCSSGKSLCHLVSDGAKALW